jgi:hypothetical protein
MGVKLNLKVFLATVARVYRRSSFNDSNRAVFDVGQSIQDFGRQWERVRQTVAGCPQYDNLQSLPGEILLETHVAVHCDEHLKASFLGFLEQYAILDSDPSQSVDRFHFVAEQAST